jgi:hypothetical protein
MLSNVTASSLEAVTPVRRVGSGIVDRGRGRCGRRGARELEEEAAVFAAGLWGGFVVADAVVDGFEAGGVKESSQAVFVGGCMWLLEFERLKKASCVCRAKSLG